RACVIVQDEIRVGVDYCRAGSRSLQFEGSGTFMLVLDRRANGCVGPVSDRFGLEYFPVLVLQFGSRKAGQPFEFGIDVGNGLLAVETRHADRNRYLIEETLELLIIKSPREVGRL